MLCMTQYRILVIMSAKGRSPVFPDMFSSVFIYIYLVILKRIASQIRKRIKRCGLINLFKRDPILIRMSLLYPGYIQIILVQYSYLTFYAARFPTPSLQVKSLILMGVLVVVAYTQTKMAKKSSPVSDPCRGLLARRYYLPYGSVSLQPASSFGVSVQLLISIKPTPILLAFDQKASYAGNKNGG